MRRRLTAMTLVIALTSLCVLPPTGALAAPGGGRLVQNITFLLNGEETEGILTIRNFTPSQQQLFANGTLSFTDPAGIGRQVPVRLPVNDITTQQDGGTCQILFLDLGPLHLELLGLIIDISQIIISITADPTAGILGSLLCAIANLFDLGDFQQVANLLRQLLDLLG
jgi:hypothetical protein